MSNYTEQNLKIASVEVRHDTESPRIEYRVILIYENGYGKDIGLFYELRYAELFRRAIESHITKET